LGRVERVPVDAVVLQRKGNLLAPAALEILEVVERGEGLGELDRLEQLGEDPLEKLGHEGGRERGGLLGQLGDLVHDAGLESLGGGAGVVDVLGEFGQHW
jgi:hypothetical protein